MRTAIFAGSFDPLTLGHVDVVRRAGALFDRVIVAVGHNPAKKRFLDLPTRVEVVRVTLGDDPGVEVATYEGLTVDFARERGAVAILRGLRDGADLGFEMPIALANRAMAPTVETVFVATDPALGFVSSSLMKEIALAGGDPARWLPPASWAALSRAMGRG